MVWDEVVVKDDTESISLCRLSGIESLNADLHRVRHLPIDYQHHINFA